MKKIIALLLVVVMVFGLVACGADTPPASGNPGTPSSDVPGANQPTEPAGPTVYSTYPEKTIKIGVEIYDPTDGETLEMQAYFQRLVDQGLNVEFIYSEALASAEAEMAFIDRCYNAGCKAIMGFYNISGGEVIQKCIDYGMYYWGYIDEATHEKYQDNPYMVDAITYGDSDYNGGYAIGEYFGKLGAKKVVYASGGAAFGVKMFVDRRNGFIDAAEKYGLEYIEVTGFPGEAFFADQAAALSEDIDGVAASFNGLDFWAQPIAAAGKTETAPLATLGSVSQAYADAFQSGSVAYVTASNVSRFAIAAMLLVNAVDGNADSLQENGRAGVYVTGRWDLVDYESAQMAADVAGDVYTFEELQALIVNINPDASAATIQEIIEAGADIEAIAARRAGN